MAVELAGVLDHIATIETLDLADVPPTSHVVTSRTRCAPTCRGRACRASGRSERAAGHRRRLRGPEPAGMSSTARSSSRGGGRGGGRSGELDAGELFEATARARAADDPERLPVGRRRARRGRRRRRAARRRPARGQGPLLHRGRAEPVGLADPRGLSPALHRDRRRAARRRGRAAARQDQPGRVRDGLLDRELGASGRRATRGTARASPAAPPAAAPPRSPRGLRAVGARHRHRRLDPPARRALRHRRPQADLRRRLALRHDRVRLVARPDRPADPRRHRRRAAATPHGRAATRCDSTSLDLPGAIAAAERGPI